MLEKINVVSEIYCKHGYKSHTFWVPLSFDEKWHRILLNILNLTLKMKLRYKMAVSCFFYSLKCWLKWGTFENENHDIKWESFLQYMISIFQRHKRKRKTSDKAHKTRVLSWFCEKIELCLATCAWKYIIGSTFLSLCMLDLLHIISKCTKIRNWVYFLRTFLKQRIFLKFSS